MNTKSYLRINGIKGTAAIYRGSEKPVRTGDIPLIEFSWGNPTFTDGRTSSSRLWLPSNQVGFLYVSRSSDETSTTFYKAYDSRDRFATMLLIVDRDPNGYAPVEIYEMIDVIVFAVVTTNAESGRFDGITFRFNQSKPPRVIAPSDLYA